MRKKRHQRGASVLISAFLGSAVFNLVVAYPLLKLAEYYLSVDPNDRPVKVVQVSAAQWSKNRQTTGVAKAPQVPAPNAKDPADPTVSTEQKKPPPEPEKPKPEPEDKLTGQVVEVPPSADDSPNPDAKYLSKYNVHVEKETTARDRNHKMKRVTNKLQTVEQQQAAEQSSIRTPNLTIKGDGRTEDTEGTKGEKKDGQQQKFVLEIPDMTRRDRVELKPGEGQGIGSRVSNRTGSEAVKGNASTFNLQLGSGMQEEGGDDGGGKKGDTNGIDDKKPLPTLSALLPTVGATGRISGSPSRDHVEGVPDGDGTFLNTKEFKYATFFYRVRDSVASHWEDLAASEYRRRDPTGNIYGIRDRSTLLQVRLSRDGHLSDVRVEQTSGVDFLDHVAVEAFKKAEPFPNPPAGIADEDGSIRFNFQFVVTMRSRSPLNLFEFQ